MRVPKEFAIKNPTTIKVGSDTKFILDQEKRANETYDNLLRRRFR